MPVTYIQIRKAFDNELISKETGMTFIMPVLLLSTSFVSIARRPTNHLLSKAPCIIMLLR